VPSASSARTNLDRLGRYFDTESVRTGEGTMSTWLPVRPALYGPTGTLRMGPLAFAVDVGTGRAMGLAALASDRWIVTTDMDIRQVTPVVSGPLRVDAEVVRTGETTVVSVFSLHDEHTGRAVGGGTATGRPFPFEFDRAILEMPIGERQVPARTEPAPAATTGEHFGMRQVEGGVVEVDIVDWLRNPWGILHGGVTSCLVELAAEAAGEHALGRPAGVTGMTIRFLAPGRVGPARAVPQVQVAADGRALIEVRVTDQGTDGRLMIVASATVE
jgi:acyl-coenzyme A thioesterase PaaI-like protein